MTTDRLGELAIQLENKFNEATFTGGKAIMHGIPFPVHTNENPILVHRSVQVLKVYPYGILCVDLRDKYRRQHFISYNTIFSDIAYNTGSKPKKINEREGTHYGQTV